MRTDQFKRLLGNLSRLTDEQLAKLQQEVSLLSNQVSAVKAVETAKPVHCCAHCGGQQFVKNGHNRGLQRYRCQACHKTFNTASGTPLSGLRQKELFIRHAECMARSMSVRQTARALGIAPTTAFRWRHRFLAEVVSHQPRQVTGLLEADEMYIRESQKGSRHLNRLPRHRGGPSSFRSKQQRYVPVLVGRLRGQPHICDRVLTAMNQEQVADALRAVVSPDTLLCTDGHTAFLKIRKDLGVTVKSFSKLWAGHVFDKVYHVQSVNSYHERIKTWIDRRFRGVATKYLPHYFAWRRILEWFKENIKPEYFIASALGRQVINA